MAKIDIILSSINNIFKKINLLNNIDKYIINKEMTGGMNSNDGSKNKEYDIDYDIDDNDVDNVRYDDGNYDVDDDYNGNGDYGDYVVDNNYNGNVDVSDYNDGDNDSDHKNLMKSISLNKDLIDQLSKLIIKLNKDPKYTNIIKLIENYNDIIAQLEKYTSEYAKMTAYLLRDNAREKIRRINELKSTVNTNITELFKETQPRLLLTLHNDQYNPGNSQYKRIEHTQPFNVRRINNTLRTDLTKTRLNSSPIIEEVDK